MLNSKYKILFDCLSPYEEYTAGMWAGSTGGQYLLGVNLSVAKAKTGLGHAGSTLLDQINCFDRAEVSRAHLGQINMIKVSSFCGPSGLIWGYDLCPVQRRLCRELISPRFGNMPVFNLDALVVALEGLLGTVQAPHFPFLPGSHVPCAAKEAVMAGPAVIYAAEGIGIPADRARNACLLMEDAGQFPEGVRDMVEYKNMVLEKLVESIIVIGRNQRVEFQEVLVGLKAIRLDDGEIGCALAASPYFLPARRAIPEHSDPFRLSLTQWEGLVGRHFMCNKWT